MTRYKMFCRKCGKKFTCKGRCSEAFPKLFKERQKRGCWCMRCDFGVIRDYPLETLRPQQKEQCDRDEDWLHEWIRTVIKAEE